MSGKRNSIAGGLENDAREGMSLYLSEFFLEEFTMFPSASSSPVILIGVKLTQ